MTKTNPISETPRLPLISIYKDRGIGIINKETIKYFKRTSAYALIQDSDDTELYSNDMEKWSLEQKTDKFKDTKWNRFLAKTVYNPSFDVTLVWTKIGTYQLNELKTKLISCIDKDDDLLTQFVEADFFKYKVESSTDFGELIKNLNTYRFDIKDEALIWKENGEWYNNK